MVEKEKMFLHELIVPKSGREKPEFSVQEFERKKGGYKSLYNLFSYTREWRFIIYSQKELTIPEIQRFIVNELMKVTLKLGEDI